MNEKQKIKYQINGSISTGKTQSYNTGDWTLTMGLSGKNQGHFKKEENMTFVSPVVE